MIYSSWLIPSYRFSLSSCLANILSLLVVFCERTILDSLSRKLSSEFPVSISFKLSLLFSSSPLALSTSLILMAEDSSLPLVASVSPASAGDLAPASAGDLAPASSLRSARACEARLARHWA